MAEVWLCAHPSLCTPSSAYLRCPSWAPVASALAWSRQQEDLALIKSGEMSFLTGFHVVGAPQCPQGGSARSQAFFSGKTNKQTKTQLVFFFRSFSFLKLELACLESAQDELWFLLPVSTKSFCVSPAGTPHCHVLCNTPISGPS